jgi:hypothetical protein
MTEAIITKPISRVDCSSKSILPTGSLKYEQGHLYQEVTMIIHRPHDGLDIGMKTGQWIMVPDEFLEALRKAR